MPAAKDFVLLLPVTAVVLLLLTRIRDLRSVFAAAMISSATAGFWMFLVSVLATPLEVLLAELKFAPTRATQATGLLGSIVVIFFLTIVPNLIVLGVVRRLLLARRIAEAPVWTTLTRRQFIFPVGIIYGELVQLITLMTWALLLYRSLVPVWSLPSYLAVPLHASAGLGGITAIGVQAAVDRRASGAMVPKQVGA